jgi:hypothetical protein
MPSKYSFGITRLQRKDVLHQLITSVGAVKLVSESKLVLEKPSGGS